MSIPSLIQNSTAVPTLRPCYIIRSLLPLVHSNHSLLPDPNVARWGHRPQNHAAQGYSDGPQAIGPGQLPKPEGKILSIVFLSFRSI